MVIVLEKPELVETLSAEESLSLLPQVAKETLNDSWNKQNFEEESGNTQRKVGVVMYIDEKILINILSYSFMLFLRKE